MIVSAEQWRDSAIHICILSQTPLHPSYYITLSRVPCAIQFLVIHFKYSSMYMSIPNALTSPIPHPSPQQPQVHSLSLWVSFCFVSSFVSFLFRLHIEGMAYDISPSLSDLLHSIWQALGPSMLITNFQESNHLRTGSCSKSQYSHYPNNTLLHINPNA